MSDDSAARVRSPDAAGRRPSDAQAAFALDTLDTLALAALVVRDDGTIADVSSGWTAFTGYSRADSVGTNFADIVDPAGAHQLQATLAGGTCDAARPAEYQLRLHGGSLRWVLGGMTRIRSARLGNAFLLTLTDFDERKRAFDAIVESESLYRQLNEALPGVTFTAAPTGELTHIFDRWLNTNEAERASSLGHAWLESVHPEDRTRVGQVWCHSLQTGEPYKIEYRIRLPNGTYHWLLVRALAQRGDDGAILRWVGVIIDIEDRHASEEARELYAALVDNSSDFIAFLGPAGDVVYVNAAGRALLEIGSLADARNTPPLDYFLAKDRAFVQSEILPALERDGRWVGDFQLRHFRTGRAVPIAFTVFALENAAGRRLGIATVSRDLREAKRVEDGLRLLSRTGAAVVDSLDYRRTLENIAWAFVDGFAAYCLIDVVRADGFWERTVRHREPAFEQVLLELERPRGNHPIARTIATGQAAITSIDEDWARGLERLPDRLEAVRRLGVRSIITVPIMTPAGGLVGAITCALDEQSARDDFENDDLAFVEEVGRRAGAAIANVRVYERERRIALELQSASLPTTLPHLPFAALDAAYQPAGDEAKIGGDWYDAFALADERFVITVGDVLGHGLQAAVSMTKLRLAMQSAAIIDPDPTLMLRVADATLRLSDPDAYATALAAVYDGATRTLTYACAGHPGPLLLGPDGNLEILGSFGSMLGLRGADDIERRGIVIPAGSTLVLYTDGLIEVTRDIDEGYRRMARALQREDLRTSERPAQALVEAVLGTDTAHDDIAVLFVRFH